MFLIILIGLIALLWFYGKRQLKKFVAKVSFDMPTHGQHQAPRQNVFDGQFEEIRTTKMK